MRWEAANVALSNSQKTDDAISNRKSSETVEAALARLTKAYSTAMTCIGAMHKLQAVSEKEGPNDELKAQSRRLASAARSTFEKAILLDPLIVIFCPTWTRAVHECGTFVQERRPEPAILTSASHKATVREIAYLSLLNYSDLLVAAQQRSDCDGCSILDTGVVKLLPLVGWDGDNNQKLALVSLCDASDLDGTDPVLWLKLACAARKLSMLSGNNSLRYKRLERHALEMGETALPSTLPPNRSIVRALREHHSLPDVYNDNVVANLELPIKLVLDIPRYSWSILGRMLVRASREGANPDSREAFGSPRVELHLSPMLLLPHRSLGLVCKYLRSEDVWRFEATCRGLSASILSARAMMERTEVSQNDAIDHHLDALGSTPQSSSVHLSEHSSSDHNRKKQIPEWRNRDEPARARSSKRVLSQLITSGKRADRESKRGSVKYCLLASILSCTSEDEMYRNVARNNVDWDSSTNFDKGATHDLSKEGFESSLAQSEGTSLDSRLGDSSLKAFLDKWSAKNSGPMDVLQRYVAHVALNVVEIFQSDQDSLALSGLIVDCVDLLARKTGGFQNLGLCSYGQVILSPGREAECFEYLSVNLLNAELRLKRSDGQLAGFGDYDSDMNVVAVTVSELLQQVPEMEMAHAVCLESRTWICMKTRLHWLAAGYYLDRSRQSQNVGESRTAEDFGIEQVERTIHSLSLPAGSPVLSVKTPHLTSPRRSGPHWKILSLSSLHLLRDEIQASSVVSAARQQFMEKLVEIERHWRDVPGQVIRPEDVTGLLGIGVALSKRYNATSEEGGAKHEELLGDFVATYEGELSSHLAPSFSKGNGEERWGSMWFLVPSGAPHIEHIIDFPSLSILTILTSCLNANDDGRLVVVELITSIAMCSFELLGKRGKGGRVARNASADDFDDILSEDGSISGGEDDVEISGPRRRGRLSGRGHSDHRQDFLVAIAAELFVDKIVDMFENHLTDEERRRYLGSCYFLAMIRSAMAFISNWYEPRGSRRASSSTGAHDLRIFLSICSLQGAVVKMNPHIMDAEVPFFLGCYKVLVRQRHLLPVVLGSGNDNRSGRSAKQKEFLGRAELIGAVLSEVAIMLSRHTSRIDGHDLGTASLIGRAFSGEEGTSNDSLSLSRLVEVLLYLWDVVLADDASGAASVFSRICGETLLVPVAASMIGLCGSLLCSFSGGGDTNDVFTTADKLSLNEFLDSDGSANECENKHVNAPSRRRSDRSMKLLRRLCHSIHCMSLVVDTVDDKNAWQYIPKTECEREKGTFLPLVATRVLSFQADILLTEFGAKATAEESLWQESFPYGTRAIGTLLDSVLHKVYKQLYGFTIYGHWIEKEKVSEEKCKTLRCPESTKAAAQLYRCIQRAYTLSRKSVPKAALECVAMALPVEWVSPSRDAMLVFMFNKQTREVSNNALSLLAKNNAHWNEPYRAYHEAAKHLAGTGDGFHDEIRMVRKGIAKELSQAPLPNISQASADSTKGIRSEDSQKTSEERAIAAFQERELSKKFWAILDNMSYGDPSDYVGWLDAAECVALKAELIADRLGSSLGSVRVTDFCIPTDNNPRQKKLMSLAALKEAQERQHTRDNSRWIPFMGEDLAIYVDYQWASFHSLEQCASFVSTKYKEFSVRVRDNPIDSESSDSIEAHAWNEIETMYRNKDFISWQQAWGGVFVEALRTIALRCLSMGYYLVGEVCGTSANRETTSLQSEILESMGIAKYSELMGSQRFGYPMRPLCEYRKREISETARICFQEAAMKVEGDENQFTFDVLFMVGKCFEKTAKTYVAESFAEENDGANVPLRMYEQLMAHAFSTYRKSLEEASSLDEEGALPDVHAGGSSHGKAEVVYRLHASRLKCLIAAYKYPDKDREKAIAEAVRLTRCCWYGDDSTSVIDDPTTNMVVWKILADIVAALAQCRLEHQFFHRSVYRYAQALMWAPVLHDPGTGFVYGSLSVVPATKSHLLRGLNSSTACANSAEVIMSALFEKKRPQLVSVWVTNTSSSPSPLEFINNSTRKFDSLRGKYFAAYVEILSLCKRSSVLEALFQQLIITKRDLPAFYQASALVRGALPETSHAKENLLGDARSSHTIGLIRDLKRITNRALASILVEEAPTLDPKNDYIKKCYTCFLRLNASVECLERMKAWQYGSASLPEVEALCLAYLARPDSNEFSVQSSDWAGGWKKTEVLKASLVKCAELFPSHASTLYRKIKPKKVPACNVSGDENEGGPQAHERSAPESDTMQFVVAVPQGLNVGDKFQTTVRIGSQMKTLRLTVPVGLPPKLKFSLKVPDDDEAESSNKRLKEN